MDPWAVARRLLGSPGLILLESQWRPRAYSRFSFLTAQPFLRFRSYGSRCLLTGGRETLSLYGNPWEVLDQLMARYEMPDQPDVPFPVGGCFGFWGYGLALFAESALRSLQPDDRELPDCDLGFYDSLVVFDHELGRTLVVTSGLGADGSRTRARALEQRSRWLRVLERVQGSPSPLEAPFPALARSTLPDGRRNCGREEFMRAVDRARQYIGRGEVYQVNLSRRVRGSVGVPPAGLYEEFRRASPAPFAMYMEGGDHCLVSHSPELFLRMNGPNVLTRPIKGTRARAASAEADHRARRELIENPKERAELLMITDLLRNDLGRLCEFGSVQVPELRRVEIHGAVHQAVASITGRLQPGINHVAALARCFPGGSVTGAPKIRAMQIIDELEPVARGPYTGCGGYLGFNRESQLNILIRTAVFAGGRVWFHTGAGIVADSCPEAEFAETEAKAAVFRAAMARLARERRLAGGGRPQPTLITS